MAKGPRAVRPTLRSPLQLPLQPQAWRQLPRLSSTWWWAGGGRHTKLVFWNPVFPEKGGLGAAHVPKDQMLKVKVTFQLKSAQTHDYCQTHKEVRGELAPGQPGAGASHTRWAHAFKAPTKASGGSLGD